MTTLDERIKALEALDRIRKESEISNPWAMSGGKQVVEFYEAAPEMMSVIRELKAERDALRDFKAYTHMRLDGMGVPTDPDSPHKASGCRIGGRMDYVEGKLK